ncbi:hypothetical protein [Anaerosporobacter sp.]|uniref:hypothetical protein n=1 Tax=Anaerosporobacter sp. TaxID=1872529 RepID=UPI00286F46DC|nr:hypothetical protein [Anaerosporobacter sp.]
MITIENFIKKDYPKDSDDLLAISEQIWKLGDLEEIERKVSAELFVLHIAINVVGNWQGDGWHGIVRDQAVLIPYITQTLDKLDLQEIKEAFQEVISMFPEFTRFVDDKLYCDIINFITNTRCKVNDERLNQYSEEERSRISKEYHEKMEKLEEISEEQWSYNAPKEGWEPILNYIKF